MRTFAKVAVIGAGTMGHSLALLFARAGSQVALVDLNRDILDTAVKKMAHSLDTFERYEPAGEPARDVLRRVTTTTDTVGAVKDADKVLEVVVENADIKRTLYNHIAPHLKADAVLCSNASALVPFELAPESLLPRMAMTHYFVPPHIIPLVEIVGSEKTDPDISLSLKAYLEQAGMVPIVLSKYIPGLIINRIQRAIFREAYALVGDGTIDAEQFDLAVKASLGIRYPVQAVLNNRDHAGIDSTLKVWKSQKMGLVDHEDVPPVLETLVAQGRLGVKAGRGFLDYGGKSPEEITRESEEKLFQMRKFMRESGLLRTGAPGR